MTRSQALAAQQTLLAQWTALIEEGLAALASDTPEALQQRTRERTRLIEAWRRLGNMPVVAPAAATSTDEADGLRALRIAARRAMMLDRHYLLALQEHDRVVRARMQMLCSAAGIDGLYSGSGNLAPIRAAGAQSLTA